MKIQRYDLEQKSCMGGYERYDEMVENADGEWVRYADVTNAPGYAIVPITRGSDPPTDAYVYADGKKYALVDEAELERLRKSASEYATAIADPFYAEPSRDRFWSRPFFIAGSDAGAGPAREARRQRQQDAWRERPIADALTDVEVTADLKVSAMEPVRPTCVAGDVKYMGVWAHSSVVGEGPWFFWFNSSGLEFIGVCMNTQAERRFDFHPVDCGFTLVKAP